MIRTIGFVVLWLGGSAAAVAVAWTGVSVVDDGLVHPAPASIINVSGDDPAEATPTTGPTPTTTITTSPTATPVPDATPSPDLVAEQPTPPPTPPPTNPPGQASPPSPRPTSAPTPTQPPTPAPAPTATTPPPTPTSEPAQTLTFNLVGGSTAISFSPTTVQVLWATPNPGFEVSIEPEPPGVKVEFDSEDHESRIDAWWSDGPQRTIREEPDDD